MVSLRPAAFIESAEFLNVQTLIITFSGITGWLGPGQRTGFDVK